MREKLKKLNIKLTDLAHYLNISRPTLYKYIDAYEQEKYAEMSKKSKKIFMFIDKNPTASKIDVIDYIIHLNKTHSFEELKSLFHAIENDEKLIDYLVHDVHQNGVKGVIKKLKISYKKENNQ